MAATFSPTNRRPKHVRHGARDHLSLRSHGRAVLAHREGLLDFRRFGGTLYITALHSPELQPASSFSTRSTSRFDVTKSDGKVRKYEHWEMSRRARRPPGLPRYLRHGSAFAGSPKAFPADAMIIATGGPGVIFGKSTNSVVCTGRRNRRSISRARVCERRVYSGTSDLDSGRRQASPDVRISSRRRRTCLGAEDAR